MNIKQHQFHSLTFFEDSATSSTSQLTTNLNPIIIVTKAVAGTAANIIIIGFAGVYLFRRGVTNEKVNGVLSKIIMNLYLPCLLFSFFIKSLNIYDFFTWLPISIFCLAHTTIGFGIGHLVQKFYIKQPKMWALILLQTGLGHTTGIFLIIVNCLSVMLDAISQKQGYTLNAPPGMAMGRAINFIMVGTLVNMVIRWTIANQIVIMHIKKYEPENEQLEDIQKLRSPMSEDNRPIEELTLFDKLKKIIIRVFNPPLTAAFIATIICLFPSAQSELNNGASAVSKILFNAVYLIGILHPQSMLINLGSNFAALGYSSSLMPKKVLITCCFLKLVVMPFIGIIMLHFWIKIGMVPDPVSVLIYMLLVAAPCAMVILILISSFSESQQLRSDISLLCLCQYLIFCFISVPIILWVYLWIYYEKVSHI